MNTPTPTTPRPSLWRRLRHAWAAFMGRVPRSARHIHKAYAELVDTDHSPLASQATSGNTTQRNLQPYNPQALPAAREQWQRGDWTSLASLMLDELQDHPDRAKLALLAGAGHMQMGRNHIGAEYLRQAKAWGCSPQLMRQIVIAGVHNTLGRASTIAGWNDRGEMHTEMAARIAMPFRENIPSRYKSVIRK